jgi:fatty-acyl-CoA synthase
MDLVSEQDRHERQRWNVADVISRGRRMFPERIAVREHGTGRVFSYRQLDDLISQISNCISARRPPCRVIGLVADNGIDAVAGWFAGLRAGAVVVPLSTRLLASEMSSFLTQASADTLLLGPGQEHLAGPLATAAPALRRCLLLAGTAVPGGVPSSVAVETNTVIASAPVTSPPVQVDMASPATAAPTGGTSGSSRLVLLSHMGLLIDALSLAWAAEIPQRPVTVQVAPLYHLAGINWSMLPTLLGGGTIVFPPPGSFSAQAFADTVAAHQANYALLVPAVVNQLVGLPDDWARKTVSLTTVTSASAPTPETLRKAFADKFPWCSMHVGYGISENLSMTILPAASLLSHPDAVGIAVPHNEITIVDPVTGEPMPRGEVGEIAARNLCMGLTYLGAPSESSKVWRHLPGDDRHFTFTGDLGTMDEDGMVRIVDRRKDMVLTGGLNVFTPEVESVLIQHPAVLEVAVVGIPDTAWGEAVHAVLVCRPGHQVIADDLNAWARERLAGYKCPKGYTFVDALPRNNFGKVLKRQIRDQLSGAGTAGPA